MSRSMSVAYEEEPDYSSSRSMSTPFQSEAKEDLRVESRPYDSTQEMRAMILAALPLPPLPVIVERLDEEGRACDEVLQTSHDVLSNLLLHACAKNSPADNAERQERQRQVLRSLIDHMANRGQLQSIPELYETYCHHTRLHACTYLPRDSRGLTMRFPPLASVCKGDATHRRMCDYMAGQAVILEEPNGHCAQDWMCREYADMLKLTRERVLAEPQGPSAPDESP